MSYRQPALQERSGITPELIPTDILSANEPVVLRGLVTSWPVVAAAREGDDRMLAYLRGCCRDKDILAFRAGSSSEGRVFYNEDLSGFNFERFVARLDNLLAQLEQGRFGDGDDYLYIGSTPVDEYFPGFRAENDLDLGKLRPLVSIWLGRQSRIAAHFDHPDNIACVVAGRRRFTLFPPEQLANLYVGPIDHTPAGQAISLVDFSDPDYERYPRFRDAMAAARVVELEPGDALFLPSMWWHHVEGLDTLNVLVNYWWTRAEGVSGNPLNALIHALLSIRNLPPEHREAWRGLFDYYVFDEPGDRFSHIPEERLGVLGKLDPETIRQLRTMLRSKLG